MSVYYLGIPIIKTNTKYTYFFCQFHIKDFYLQPE